MSGARRVVPRGLENDGVIVARGGAKIWTMRKAWMPSQCTCDVDRRQCLRHKGQQALNEQMSEGADPDGFAVFGQFPYGFLKDVVKMKLLGDVPRQDILHVCSGTLSEHERWTVDIRPAARPAVIAKGSSHQRDPCAAGHGATAMSQKPDYLVENLRGMCAFPTPYGRCDQSRELRDFCTSCLAATEIERLRALASASSSPQPTVHADRVRHFTGQFDAFIGRMEEHLDNEKFCRRLKGGADDSDTPMPFVRVFEVEIVNMRAEITMLQQELPALSASEDETLKEKS